MEMGEMKMWTADNIIATLKEIQKQHHISGSMDAGKFCMELGLDFNGLVYLLSYLFAEAFKEIREADDELHELRAENERLNMLLGDKCQGNGRTIQMAKVMAGLPIAKKSKKSLADLDLQIMLGATDGELMEYFEISRTTLWRWKKELAEKKKSGKSLYF